MKKSIVMLSILAGLLFLAPQMGLAQRDKATPQTEMADPANHHPIDQSAGKGGPSQSSGTPVDGTTVTHHHGGSGFVHGIRDFFGWVKSSVMDVILDTLKIVRGGGYRD
jgi:hypothetical protein